MKLRHFTKFCVQKNMSNEKEVFDAKMSSEKGLEADPLRREKGAQEMREVARELAAARLSSCYVQTAKTEPTKQASRGKSDSAQRNANEQLSNGSTKPVSRGKSADNSDNSDSRPQKLKSLHL